MKLDPITKHKELFYWERFPPDIRPPNTARVRLTRVDYRFGGATNILIDTNTYEQTDKQASRRNDVPLSHVRLIDLNVDRNSAQLPARELDFKNQYENYRNRVYPGSCEYAQMIDDLADSIINQIKKIGKPPDAFIAIPSRKEVNTNRAFQVIKGDFLSSSITPMILILHNDTEKPSKNTLEDLAKIRQDEYGFVIDLRFTPNCTIGDARAIMADVVMEINYRLGVVIPMAMADADTTKIPTQGTYANITSAMKQDPEIDITVVQGRFDPETMKNDETFTLRHQIIGIVEDIIEKFVPLSKRTDRGVTGAYDVLNTLWLPALGGFPRTSVMEDVILGAKLKEHRGMQGFFSLPSGKACIEIAGDRHAYDYRHAKMNL